VLRIRFHQVIAILATITLPALAQAPSTQPAQPHPGFLATHPELREKALQTMNACMAPHLSEVEVLVTAHMTDWHKANPQAADDARKKEIFSFEAPLLRPFQEKCRDVTRAAIGAHA
jgi:hypothetical protein